MLKKVSKNAGDVRETLRYFWVKGVTNENNQHKRKSGGGRTA